MLFIRNSRSVLSGCSADPSFVKRTPITILLNPGPAIHGKPEANCYQAHRLAIVIGTSCSWTPSVARHLPADRPGRLVCKFLAICTNRRPGSNALVKSLPARPASGFAPSGDGHPWNNPAVLR